MTQDEAIQLLKTQMAEWNRRREGGEEVFLNLSDADLSNAILYRAGLSGANLIDANLSDATRSVPTSASASAGFSTD